VTGALNRGPASDKVSADIRVVKTLLSLTLGSCGYSVETPEDTHPV